MVEQKIGGGNEPQDFDTDDGKYLKEGEAKSKDLGEFLDDYTNPQVFGWSPNREGRDENEPNIPPDVLRYCNDLSDEEIKKSSGWLSGIGTQDEVLKKLIHLRGFDKKPKIVSRDEISKKIEEGYRGFIRGMKVDFGDEQYKNGDMYIGRGVHGSGVYVSCFDSKDMRDIAVSTAESYATDTITKKFGSIVYGVIEKDTKIITESKLVEIRDKLSSHWSEKQKMCFRNNGKLGVALGYDMIDCENNLYYIVLNRSKTIVGGN